MVSEEELKTMSPEQIAEMQKQNCIFCHIVNGRVQSKKVFEDDKVVAILDINPANPGHVLLIPKEHYSIMPLVPENIIGHMFMVAKAISNACLKALQVQGTNVFVANGAISGQKAPHFMIHIIPRKEKDGLDAIFKLQHKQIAPSDQEQVWIRLKQKINQVFGIKEDIQQPQIEQQKPEEENVIDADFADLDHVSKFLESGVGKGDSEDEETEEGSAEERKDTKAKPKQPGKDKGSSKRSETEEELDLFGDADEDSEDEGLNTGSKESEDEEASENEEADEDSDEDQEKDEEEEGIEDDEPDEDKDKDDEDDVSDEDDEDRDEENDESKGRMKEKKKRSRQSQEHDDDDDEDYNEDGSDDEEPTNLDDIAKVLFK